MPGKLPTNYRQGWKMSNNATDAVNDLDVTVGSARDDADNNDITATAVTTLQIDQTSSQGANLGFRQSTDTLTDGSWWKIFMIDGSGGTLPFAVKDGSSVTLPTGFTRKALIGYIYYVDATLGLIDIDHGDDGFVRFTNASEMPEDLDDSTPVTTFTDVSLTLHRDIKLALVSWTTKSELFNENDLVVAVRPKGSTWDGITTAERNPGVSVSITHNLDRVGAGIIALPVAGDTNQFIQYRAMTTTNNRVRIYTMGFYNGFVIP